MEEIIIDGIDVSNCDEFIKEHHSDRNMCNIDWEACTTQCAYGDLARQLKRKEKECEELKQQFKILSEQLKAENRELKAYRDVMEQADFKGSFDKMCLENRKLIAKLKEIKEIASVWFVDGLNEEADYYNTEMRNILGIIGR